MKSKNKSILLNLLTILALSLSNMAMATSTAPKSRLGRDGDFVLKQFITPGFERLPLQRKLFVYHLANAFEAAHDIVWHQNSKHGPAVKEIFDQIWLNKHLIPQAVIRPFKEYMFKLYGNHGYYDDNLGGKFVPEAPFTAEVFMDLVSAVHKENLANGRKDRGLVQLAENLKELIFNPNVEKYLHAPADQDQVAQSGVNYYGPTVTQSDVEALPESQNHIVSYPYRRTDGTIGIVANKIGGRFDYYLRMLDQGFQQALPYATSAEKEIIAAHRKALHSGNPEDIKKAEGLWTKNKSSDVEFIVGFIETYGDPVGVRASWEAILMVMNQDPATVSRIQNIRSNADYFERMTPVEDRFKKEPGFTPPQAEGAFLVSSYGDNGEKPFSGVNLPNYKDVQEQYGSKSYTALNVMQEYGSVSEEDSEQANQMYFLPEYRAMKAEFDKNLLRNVQVEFHEILGHGSTKNLPGVNDEALGTYYSPLEEGRAETASLYHATDIAIRNFDIIPKDWSDEKARRFAEFMIVDFFTDHVIRYHQLADDATEIRQAHQWGRLVMLTRMLEDGALTVHVSEHGFPQFKLTSLEKAREVLGKIWADFQLAKGTGNQEMAKEFFEKWGKYTDQHKQWRQAVITTREILNLPKQKAVTLNPPLQLVNNGQDVAIKYFELQPGQDIFDLMLDFQVSRRHAVEVEDCGAMLQRIETTAAK